MRAADSQRRASLRTHLQARAQDADEYLGGSAETARHYLSRLAELRQE